MTREGTQRLLAVTAAPVTKSLLAVDQLNASGHVVVFDQDNSFIFNKFSGELNTLRKEDGNFVLHLWVPPSNSQTKALFSQAALASVASLFGVSSVDDYEMDPVCPDRGWGC